MKEWPIFTLFSLYLLTVANCGGNRVGQVCTTQSGTPGTFQSRQNCPSFQNDAQRSKNAGIVCCPHQTFTRSVTTTTRRRKVTTRKVKRRKTRASTPAPDPYASVCGRGGVSGPKRKTRSVHDEELSSEYYDRSDNITDSDLDYPHDFNFTTSMVVGGSQAIPHSWPWMVALMEKPLFSSRWKTFCGGCLVSNRFVVSAGHCVKTGRRVRNDFAVRLGGHTLNDGMLRSVDHTYVHPNYRNYYNDIALIRMREPTVFTTHVMPICLPTEEIAASSLERQTATATGWGVTQAGGSQTAYLRQVQVTVVPRAECNRAYSAIQRTTNAIKTGQICANGPGKDTCQGDSGGPLQFYRNERWYLVGVTSYGQGCALRQYPGVYTKVGYYKNWIRSYVERGY